MAEYGKNVYADASTYYRNQCKDRLEEYEKLQLESKSIHSELKKIQHMVEQLNSEKSLCMAAQCVDNKELKKIVSKQNKAWLIEILNFIGLLCSFVILSPMWLKYFFFLVITISSYKSYRFSMEYKVRSKQFSANLDNSWHYEDISEYDEKIKHNVDLIKRLENQLAENNDAKAVLVDLMAISMKKIRELEQENHSNMNFPYPELLEQSLNEPIHLDQRELSETTKKNIKQKVKVYVDKRYH